MKKQFPFFLTVLFAWLLAASCVETKTVTKAELEVAKTQWAEPKVSIWYYVGSKGGYHHFLHYDLNKKVLYRISNDELTIDSTFPLTKDRNDWKVMPWGVHAP